LFRAKLQAVATGSATAISRLSQLI